MKKTGLIIGLMSSLFVNAQYAPPAGQTGTTAIYKDSSIFVNWVKEVTEFNRGYQNIADQSLGLATFGDSSVAIGQAVGSNSGVVSLGDYGSITLTFQYPIKNGVGPDFAIFENGFSDTFLELAFVEVSTDGVNFVRFPAVSLTPETEIGGFGAINATKIHNLAGKYKLGYGTPFDLEDLIDSTGIDLDEIRYVKLIDVVGTTNPQFATYDSQGHIVIDPYATPFVSSGFDLDAVGVINENQNVSVKENNKIKFSIYPNPSYGQININSATNGKITVYDFNGKVVLSKNVSATQTITLGELNKGIYFIKFFTKEAVETKKVVIQ